MSAIKTVFCWAVAASCVSLLVVLLGTSWGPCGPATPWGMLAMYVGLPIGGMMTLGLGLILLVDFLLQNRPSKPVPIDPKDLSKLKLSLNQLEEGKLGPGCTSEAINVSLLDTSTRCLLNSIVEQGFLTSDEIKKLELSSRNLAVAVDGVGDTDVSYLENLALLVNQALRFAGKRSDLTRHLADPPPKAAAGG